MARAALAGASLEKRENEREMDPEQQRLQQLRRDLEFHDYRYHVLDHPVISDAEYDRLFRELQEALLLESHQELGER